MSYLKQSTASQSRAIGPFLDDTDFKTAETGLTIANTDIKLIINGAASANKNSGGGTHRANGVYGITFDATDTATVGEIEVSVVVAGALPVFHKFWVLEEAVYDALFAASAPGYLQPTTAGRTLDVSTGGEAGLDWANIGSPTTAVNLSGTNIDVDQVVASVSGNVGGNVTGSIGSVATGGITAGSIAADAIGASELAADAATEIGTAVWAAGTRTITALPTMPTDWLSATGLSSGAVAKIEAALLNEGDGNALIAAIVAAIDAADIDTTLIAGLVRDAILDRVLSGNHDTAGSVGKILQDTKTQTAAIEADTQDLQTQVGTDGAGLTNLPWNASWDAEVQSEVTDALNAYDPPTKAELDSAVSPLATSSALATVGGYIDTEIGTLQTSVNDLPTNSELATALAGADDAILAILGTPASSIAADIAGVPTATGAFIPTAGTIATEVWESSEAAALLAVAARQVIRAGTIGSTGNSTTTLHLDGLPFGDDELNGLGIVVYDVSADENHVRWIEDWVLSTELATLSEALPFTPQNATDTYTIFAVRRDVNTQWVNKVLIGGSGTTMDPFGPA